LKSIFNQFFNQFQEQLQREAFEVLQRTRDYRNQLITNQILLIENELTNLTQVEMQRKDDKLDSILNDIRIQRAKLAFLLSRLLTEKKERELHLREQLRKMEQRRNQIQDENFWLVQYQYLLEQQPIETQIQQFAIEGRVAIVLLAVHKDNERIVKYLPLFTQITFDRLNSMGDKELLNFGIDDYELCKVIRDKIDEQCSDTASALPQTPRPSAPTQLQLPVVEEQSTSSATIVYEQNESFCDIKLWCQTECVICFDQSVSNKLI
jgi:E3 ubiquitin-protein ligase LRSAM1